MIFPAATGYLFAGIIYYSKDTYISIKKYGSLWAKCNSAYFRPKSFTNNAEIPEKN